MNQLKNSCSTTYFFKNYATLLKKTRRKRGWILFTSALAQFLVLLYVTSVEMISRHVSPYIYVPVALTGALLMSLGGSMILLFLVGAWCAVTPVRRDQVNPLNYAAPIKSDTKIAVLLPIYHEDPARVAGGILAMMEELSKSPDASKFEWFVLSDSRNVNIIVQEEMMVFLVREAYPLFKVHYRNRITNSFAKVGNTSDFYRRWGKFFKYVVMLDADSILPGKSFVDLVKSMEGNDKIGLIQSRFFEIKSDTIFGMVSNFRFLVDNFLYTYYYNFFFPGRGFYMGHNAILRTDAFMKCCNLPVMKRNLFFPGGKLTSHDYYEGCLIQGGGYYTWILPQIISFDQQLHNMTTFYVRERRWLVGAQDWFRLFMSSSLDTFGKINMFQRAIFYYASTLGLFTFCLAYFESAWVFQHPLKERFLLEVFQEQNQHTGFKLIVFASLILFLKSFSQMLIYFFVFKRIGWVKKMGGTIKFFVSYRIFSMLQSFIMLIATCLINLFLWAWIKRQPMVWSAQDREGTALTWKDCIEGYFKISLIGLIVINFVDNNIFPYMHVQQFRILGMNVRAVEIPYLKMALIFPAVILFLSPLFVRFTSLPCPLFKKFHWLKMPYDDEDQHSVVKNTFLYAEQMREKIPSTIGFLDALKSPWFSTHHILNSPSRPKKFSFWKNRLEARHATELSPSEQKLILRCRELWALFYYKEHGSWSM